MRARTRAALAFATIAAAAVAATTASAAPSVTVIARGLDNPRGVAVASDGTVFVAEAGRAGKMCLGKGANATCVGYTGKLTRIGTDGTKKIVSSGFFSAGGRDGSFTTGVDDVAINYQDGRPWVIMTDVPTGRKGLPARIQHQAGKVLRITPSGYRAIEGDVGAYETANNPDGQDVNPNPYSLAIRDGVVAAADAGGNTALTVNGDKSVTLAGVIPNIGKAQPVPTSIAIGPDGAYYIGTLAEAAGPGGAEILRLVPGQAPTVWATGFTTIVGIDVADDGTVYVAELLRNGFAQTEKGDFTGAVFKVTADGTKTELAKGEIMGPGGLALGPDGSVYVSTFSVFPGRGQVVKITQ